MNAALCSHRRSSVSQPVGLRYLAIAQGVGAIAGLFGLRVWNAFLPHAVSRLAMALALGYFSLALVASILLWRRHPAGIPLSLGAQVPQILTVIAPGGILYFLAGISVRFTFEAWGFGAGLSVGGLAEATAVYGAVPGRLGSLVDVRLFRFFLPPEGVIFGVNLAAACVSWWLMQLWMGEEGRGTNHSLDVTAPAA